jgi:hypothetical protein
MFGIYYRCNLELASLQDALRRREP